MPGPYDVKDAAKNTDVSVDEASDAWHQARNDAETDELGGDRAGDRHRSGDSRWDRGGGQSRGSYRED